MTKKDYTAIAQILCNARQRSDQSRADPTSENPIDPLINELADYLELDNARFERWRFLDACTRPAS